MTKTEEAEIKKIFGLLTVELNLDPVYYARHISNLFFTSSGVRYSEEDILKVLKPVTTEPVQEDFLNKEVRVLDKGFIRLDAVCADDLSVVNSARVSFGKRKDKMDESDEKLIAFLIRNQHHTPFEQNYFRFHVKAPIFVFREWMRHRISSFNELSGRYSELEPDFYIPHELDVRKQVGKPGHYTFESLDRREAVMFNSALANANKEAYKQYQHFLQSGVAKELARMFLPVNLYSQMYWSCNARSLMHFISLRNSEQAQLEIREYAIQLETVFKQYMPTTAKAFLENNRFQNPIYKENKALA